MQKQSAFSLVHFHKCTIVAVIYASLIILTTSNSHAEDSKSLPTESPPTPTESAPKDKNDTVNKTLEKPVVYRRRDKLRTNLGIVYGHSHQDTEAAFTLGSQILNRLDTVQRDDFISYLFGESYGYSGLRIELGTGVGISVSTTGGRQLMGAESFPVFPHIGIELTNIQFSLNTLESREDYFEWSPSFSAGLHVRTGLCSSIGLGRAGLSLGTLGNGGTRPMVGAGFYMTCDVFTVSSDLNHIFGKDEDTDESRGIELANLAVGYTGPDQKYAIMIRVDSLGYLQSTTIGEATPKSLFETGKNARELRASFSVGQKL